jgi:hypothetical protein
MLEQDKLTKLGKTIIPVELVGRNANYRVLTQPAKMAYPKGNEVRYSDDYIYRLNDTYSLNEVLGKHVKNIAQRRGLERFVMGSPLNNSEGEDILAYILINSAQANSWQPFIIDVPQLTDTSIQTAREYLERVENISPTYNRGMIEGGILFGLSVAKGGGLALPIEHDNKVIVVPSQRFLEYAAQQK